MLGMGGMTRAAGNLAPASDHLKSYLLILQMFHNDGKVLQHRPHLVVKMLLQLPLSFFRCGGLPAQLRSNGPILIVVFGGVPHYNTLPLGIWDDLIVDRV